MAKRLTCIILSVVMLLCVFPVAVFAGSEQVTYGNAGEHTLTALDNTKLADTAKNYVCRIGDGTSEATTTYYETLIAAYNALPAGNDTSIADKASITVTMIDDFTGGFRNDDTGNAKAMILEGNGFTWLNNANQYAFIWVNADFTARNLTYGGVSTDSILTRGFQFRAHDGSIKMDVLLENCTFTSENIGVDLRGNDTSNTKHVLTINNCSITSLATATVINSFPLYGNHGTKADWNITVNDSKLSNQNTNTNSGNPNAVLGLYNGCDLTVALKGNTVLEAATNSTVNGNHGIYINQAASLNLTIEDTVRFELNVPNNVAVKSTFIYTNTGTITDNGATYTANANAVANGVVVPSCGPAKSGYDLVGWTIAENSDEYTNIGGTYTGSAAVTFYPYYAAAPKTDEQAVAQGNVAKTDVDGNGVPEYHPSVAAAVARLSKSVKQLDGLSDAEKAKQTVTLIDNIASDADWGEMINAKGALILNANGKTVKTTTLYAAINMEASDLTIMNCPRFESLRIARVYANVDDVDVTVQNSNLIATGVMGLYLTSATTVKDVSGTVTVDGSSILTTAGTDGNNSSPIFTHYNGQCGKVSWTINVNNSTLTQTGSITSTDAVIAAQTGENLTINITGNSVLKNAGTNGAKTHYGIYVSNAHAEKDVKINVESTAKILLATPANVNGKSQFIYAPASAKVTNNGKTVVNGQTVKNGVILDDGKEVFAWIGADGSVVAAGEVPANASADAEFAPLPFSAEDFQIRVGAAIKTDGTIGIQFTTRVSEKLVTLLGDKITFGTFIAVSDEYLSDTTFTKLNLFSEIAYTTIEGDELKFSEAKDGYIDYYACIVDLPETAAAVNTKFTARSFFTVTYANGKQTTVYNAYSAEDNTRSIYEIATKAVAAGDTCDAYTSIIAMGGAQ